METNKRLMNLLGIARRAGKLELGGEAVKQAVRAHHVKLVYLSRDLSQRTARAVKEEASAAGVKVAELPGGMDAAQAALGRRTGVIAVEDAGFAEALLKLSEENEEEPIHDD